MIINMKQIKTFLEKCVAGGLDAAAITDLILAVKSFPPYVVMPWPYMAARVRPPKEWPHEKSVINQFSTCL